MKTLLSFLGGLALGAAALGLLHFGVPLALLATLAMGATCLAWLVLIVVLPWNVYFQARRVLFEVDRSRQRGLPVNAAQEAEARRVAVRMLRVAIGLHLGSAGLMALGSWLYERPLGYAFAGLYLLTTLFRPAVEYYRALTRRLGDFLDETKYPRDDARKLVEDVRDVVRQQASQHKAMEVLGEHLAEVERAAEARDFESRRKLEAIARRFEETIDRLTDNQEIISGIKAFLRLVQQPKESAKQ